MFLCKNPHSAISSFLFQFPLLLFEMKTLFCSISISLTSCCCVTNPKRLVSVSPQLYTNSFMRNTDRNKSCKNTFFLMSVIQSLAATGTPIRWAHNQEFVSITWREHQTLEHIRKTTAEDHLTCRLCVSRSFGEIPNLCIYTHPSVTALKQIFKTLRDSQALNSSIIQTLYMSCVTFISLLVHWFTDKAKQSVCSLMKGDCTHWVCRNPTNGFSLPQIEDRYRTQQANLPPNNSSGWCVKIILEGKQWSLNIDHRGERGS